MKITRIEIEGWRSIKYVVFNPADITVLVGSNNAGKTNILSAINFVLGDRYPMPANLLDTDFYGSDRRNRIAITITLDHPRYSKVIFDTSRETYALQAFDRRGYPVRPFSNAHREDIAFAYVDAARNFERQFSVSRWSLFGQAIRKLHDDLHRKDSNNVEQLKEVLDEAHQLLKTDMYLEFEKNLREAFAAQLRTARYDVAFEFRTLDETNLYRSLYPTIVERGRARNPTEVGSGVRNLLVLALFQAFARSFRGSAVVGIEEPELYLHPHAQRSLMREMEELAEAGNQIFISSHSAYFLDLTRSDRIVLVERCEDEDTDVCTQVRTTDLESLLERRQWLHPERDMTVDSMRAFLRNVRTTEMTEPYFAHLVVIVEGPSEREALPIFATNAGLDFDEHGISVVSANGKTAIDTLAHLYAAHGIRSYVIFDNDAGQNAHDRAYNKTMCRLFDLPETDLPKATVESNYAILDGNWENQCSSDFFVGHDMYDALIKDAKEALGISGNRNKPLVARYVAEKLAESDNVPYFVTQIIDRLREKLPPGIHPTE